MVKKNLSRISMNLLSHTHTHIHILRILQLAAPVTALPANLHHSNISSVASRLHEIYTYNIIPNTTPTPLTNPLFLELPHPDQNQDPPRTSASPRLSASKARTSVTYCSASSSGIRCRRSLSVGSLIQPSIGIALSASPVSDSMPQP